MITFLIGMQIVKNATQTDNDSVSIPYRYNVILSKLCFEYNRKL